MCTEQNSPQVSVTDNPVLVNVTRGGIVESRHRGAYCVVDVNANVVDECGDINQPTFPRSSIKIMQALELIECGAADEFGFTDEELALACSSHGGEVTHTATAQSMLSKMGLSKEQLQCGSHWPMYEPAGRALAMEGEQPNELHNNCSGKHSGFLAVLKHKKINPTDYVKPDHPLQLNIKKHMEELCECSLEDAPVGIDGCSIPTWALPLKNLALGFAKFTAPKGPHAEAMKRLTKAVFSAPFMVAGSERYCSRLMAAFGDRVFVKVGAEGVFCAFAPEQKLGFAVKCDDGAFRGAEIILTRLLEKNGVLTREECEERGVGDLFVTTLKNRKDIEVGEIKPAF